MKPSGRPGVMAVRWLDRPVGRREAKLTSAPPRLSHSAVLENHMLQPGLGQLPTGGKPRWASTDNGDGNRFHLSWSDAAGLASVATATAGSSPMNTTRSPTRPDRRSRSCDESAISPHQPRRTHRAYGGGDFDYIDEELGDRVAEQLATADAIILGRRKYAVPGPAEPERPDRAASTGQVIGCPSPGGIRQACVGGCPERR